MELERLLLAYDELSKQTKLDYTKQDVLFTPDKPYKDIDVYTQFILDLKDYDIHTDDINTNDLMVNIESEVVAIEKENKLSYPELKSTKILSDINSDKPHELEKIINAYNKLNKIADIGYARQDLLFNPNQDYGNITVFQAFVLDCKKHNIELS
jgi:hypothetical protein